MSQQLDYLSIGMGGPTLLMSDGDIANNIRGYAVQALEDCVFSQIDLDMTPVVPTEKRMKITAVTNSANTFTLSSADANRLVIGDRLLLNWGGVDMPVGTIQESTNARPTEFKDKSIYFIQAISYTDFTIILEESVGAGVITVSDDGTLYGDNTWVAKVSDQSFSYGTFTRKVASNDRTHEIAGAVDGRVFKTSDDSGLQVNLFDTTGTSTVGDVTVPRGMTVYLPVTDITITTGACIVYTRPRT